MSIPKKTHQSVRQNGKLVKKSHKHDANLQKNSTLYFQIGLIVCLLTAYGLLEMRFESVLPESYATVCPPEEDLLVYNDVPIKIFEEEAKKIEEKTMPVIFNDPIIKDDEPYTDETPDVFTEAPITNEPPIHTSKVPDVIDIEETFSIIGVERVPIYPGCENANSNKKRRKCMSDKINKLIRNKFNTNLASTYGLTGVQKIYVQFKIDKTGNVTNIKTRAPHDKLEDEAERVISKIPQMIPGKQSNKNVGVIYQLPIKFQVQD